MGRSELIALKELAYEVEITNAAGTETANISATWTRGLAAHPLGKLVNLATSPHN